MSDSEQENELLNDIESLDRIVADCITTLDSLRGRISVILLEEPQREVQDNVVRPTRCMARNSVASVRDKLGRLRELLMRTNDEVDL